MIPTKITIHHEAGNNGFLAVNEYHKHKFNFKSLLGYFVGYQYYIDKSGKVYQARKDDEEGAHTKGYNQGNIGVCLQGNFDNEILSKIQIQAIQELLQKKMNEYSITADNVKGHRAYRDTSCPGKNITDTDIRAWANGAGQLSALQKMVDELKKQIEDLMRKLGLLK